MKCRKIFLDRKVVSILKKCSLEKITFFAESSLRKNHRCIHLPRARQLCKFLVSKIFLTARYLILL